MTQFQAQTKAQKLYDDYKRSHPDTETGPQGKHIETLSINEEFAVSISYDPQGERWAQLIRFKILGFEEGFSETESEEILHLN
jgi:hypothetical protein